MGLGLEGSPYEPTVSVIIPAMNAEATIGDLLESLMRVDYARDKLEIIVVDGGSTDGTEKIVKMYPVKLIVERRRGINVARNTGVKNSRGEIIFFTDADCVVTKDWIKIMVRNFEDPEVGCVGGTVVRYRDDFLSRYADNSVMPVLRRFKKREVLENVKLFFRYPAGCNMAMRRKVIEEAGGFDENILYGFDEDELVERACRMGYKMVLDPNSVIKHQHRSSLKNLLKQTFNYGRGGALLLRRRGVKESIPRWIMATLTLFLAWLAACVALAFLASTVNVLFLVPLLSITVLPLVILTAFYFVRALKSGEYVIAFTYPLIDVLRLFAFCTGGLYGVITAH